MICYVVLHYKNIEETIKCIESLRRTAASNSIFIVVDNGSGDNSGERLKARYSSLTQCEIILLPKNLGFSKGNNAGYNLAKEKYNPDYIVVTNNDVVFYQKDFEKKIIEVFNRTKFHVLGPDVYIPRHQDHQSPLFKRGITIDELNIELKEYRYYQQNPEEFEKRLRIHALKNMLCSKSRLINWAYGKIRGKDSLNYRKEYEGVGLQGSCLIFSTLFINKEDKAFDPEPFLYEEEEFLFYRCKQKGYKMVYTPEIGIRHEEGASFNYGDRSNIEKLKFMLRHHVKAREQLMEYMKESDL